MEQTTGSADAVAEALASSDILGGLDADVIGELAGRMERVAVPGGRVIMRQGDPADCLYVLVSGRVQVLVSAGGDEQVVNELGPGELLGEMGLLSGTPRSSTVRTARDTVLLRLPADGFEEVVARHPAVVLRISRMLARRLEAATSRRRRVSRVATVAVLPAGRSTTVSDLREACERLASGLGRYGRAGVVGSAEVDAAIGEGGAQAPAEDDGSGPLLAWLHQLEQANEFVVYAADLTPSAWTERCLRQADRVLLVARADGDPGLGPVEEELRRRDAAPVRTDLVLVHGDGVTRPSRTAAWIDRRDAGTHHHVRRSRVADYERVARFLTGRAVGLVLGGGGPRGFAHLGAMRALEEAGVPIDAVGGTSIGSIMGAMYAMGWSHEDRVRQAMAAFVETRFLIGPTFPLVSLSSSRKLTRLLRADENFSDVQIEDLWYRWFCVSANLSRADQVVHERGDAWWAMRASISLPGILPPVYEGGDLLVDGGIVNNLPADVMAERVDGGRVVAVDLQSDVELRIEEPFEPHLSGWRVLARKVNPFRPSLPVPNIVAVIMRTKEIGSTRAQREILARSLIDLYLRPPVDGFPMLDFSAGPQLVDIGYRSTIEQLERQGVAELVT